MQSLPEPGFVRHSSMPKEPFVKTYRTASGLEIIELEFFFRPLEIGSRRSGLLFAPGEWNDGVSSEMILTDGRVRP